MFLGVYSDNIFVQQLRKLSQARVLIIHFKKKKKKKKIAERKIDIQGHRYLGEPPASKRYDVEMGRNKAARL